MTSSRRGDVVRRALALIGRTGRPALAATNLGAEVASTGIWRTNSEHDGGVARGMLLLTCASVCASIVAQFVTILEQLLVTAAQRKRHQLIVEIGAPRGGSVGARRFGAAPDVPMQYTSTLRI